MTKTWAGLGMLAGLLVAGVAYGQGAQPGGTGAGTGHYTDNGPTSGPNQGQATDINVHFGPCVNGRRTVTLQAGGRIRGEQITKVSQPQDGGTAPCGKKGSGSKTWVVELETVVKDPNNPNGPLLSTTTFTGTVTVTWSETAGTAAAPGLTGGSNGATIRVFFPGTVPATPVGPPIEITGAKGSETGIGWSPEQPAKPGEKEKK